MRFSNRIVEITICKPVTFIYKRLNKSVNTLLVQQTLRYNLILITWLYRLFQNQGTRIFSWISKNHITINVKWNFFFFFSFEECAVCWFLKYWHLMMAASFR